MANAVVIRGNDMVKEQIDLSLKGMQTLVEGHLEVVYLGQGFIMLVNEDGIAMGLERNALGLRGTAVIIKAVGEEWEGLNDEELDFVYNSYLNGVFTFK